MSTIPTPTISSLKVVILQLLTVITCGAHGQDTLYFEQFEGPDMETYQLYDGSNNPVSFNVGGFGGSDYIQRALPEDLPTSVSATGFSGNIIGFEDTDGAGFFGIPFITTDAITVTGKIDLQFTMKFASPRLAGSGTLETSDFLNVEFKLDGSQWTQAHYVQGATDRLAYYDLDLDGVTDGSNDQLLTEQAVAFTYAIAGVGSSLLVRISMGSQGAHEEFVFDDVLVTGIEPCTTAIIDGVSFQDTVCDAKEVALNISGTLNDALTWTIRKDSIDGSWLDSSYAGQFTLQPDLGLSSYYVIPENNCEEGIFEQIQIVRGQEYLLYDTASICSNTSYTFADGNTLEQVIDSVTYYSVLSTRLDCDSIIATTVYENKVNTTVILEDATLIAQAENATFEWISCGEAQVEINEHDSSYTPGKDGSYAVVVTQNHCIATSECIEILHVGTASDLTGQLGFSVSPNPTTGRIRIEGSFSEPQEVIVCDVLGQAMDRFRIHTTNSYTFAPDLPNGIYYLSAPAQGQFQPTKLLLYR